MEKNVTAAVANQEHSDHALWYQRRPFAVSTALMLICALTVTVLVASNALSPADLRVTQELQESVTPSAIGAMRVVSLFGSVKVMIPLTIAAFVLLLVREEHRAATFFAAASVLMVVITHLLKVLINRARPAEPVVAIFDKPGDSSFPSGHVTSVVIFAGFLAALVILSSRRSRITKVGAGTSAAVAVGLAGFSRIYLGAHWLSDVIDGYLIAGAALAIAVAAFARMSTVREWSMA